MIETKANNREIVTICHNHIGGMLGEALFNFLVNNKWIEFDKDEGEYTITELGWNELEIIGIDVQKLRSTDRSRIVPCIERHYGIFHEHSGELLGKLLADWLLEAGWIVEKEEYKLVITKKGLRGLASLGVDIRVINEYL